MTAMPYGRGVRVGSSPAEEIHPLSDGIGPASPMERELRGRILDEYLVDYERRKGPISKRDEDEAQQFFDGVFADE